MFLDADAQLEKYQVLLSRMETIALGGEHSRNFIHTIALSL
ncbi:hypothetical protein [Streptomyces sp. LN549]